MDVIQIAIIPFMSFSRSYTMKAYPLLGLLLGLTLSLTIRIWKHVSILWSATIVPKAIYPFNRSKASKFTFEVRFFHIVAEPRNEESLERITSGLRVLGRINCERVSMRIAKAKCNISNHTILNRFINLAVYSFLLLQLLAPFALDPALRRSVRDFLLVFLDLREILSNTADCALFYVLRCAVDRGHIA